jgi:hypothetical protein
VRRESEVIARLRAEFGEDVDYRRPLWDRTTRELRGDKRRIGDELQTARSDAERLGQIVACLVPARTDTRWWHDIVTKGEVRFIQGRVRLDGHGGSPPFPSAVVVFGLPARIVWWWPKVPDEQLRLGEVPA